MKNILTAVIFLLSISLFSSAFAQDTGTALKPEGSCTGTLLDGTAVAFNYYSDFDGCKDVSAGAISFSAGIEGLLTGKRSFINDKDVYSVPGYQVKFADSTGNTSGTFHYTDMDGKKQKVVVQCEVRDYAYPENC